MRALKLTLVAISALLILFAGIGLLLPRHVVVERSIAIKAPAATVFALVDGYTHFNSFSPWAGNNPATAYDYSGPRNGVGATMIWRSKNPHFGSGKQQVIESVPYEQVRSVVDMEEMGEALSTFLLNPTGDVTHVNWRFEAELDASIQARWSGRLFDRWIGADFENGLARLAVLAENFSSVDIAELDISEVVLTRRPLLLSSHEANVDENGMREAMDKAYDAMQKFMAARNIPVPAESIIITRDWNEAENRWRFDAAYPLPAATAIDVSGTPFTISASWQGDALRSILRGADYTTSAMNYEKIALYMKLYCYRPAADSWEAYRSDPINTPPEQLVTEIFFPVTEEC